MQPSRVTVNVQPHPGNTGAPLQASVNTAAPMGSALNTASPIAPTTPMSDIPPADHLGMTTMHSQHADSQPTTSAVGRVYLGVSDEKGARDHMEDRHTLIADFKIDAAVADVPRSFMAVYDGHSSHKGSEHASRRVHEHITKQDAVKQCKGEPKDAMEAQSVEAALKDAFLDVDQEIIHHAVKRGHRYGTTAVIALRIGNVLYIAHAGDSGAILCRDGQATRLTQDHKPASVPEERERIEAEGGRISYREDRVYSNPESGHISRLNMSRALGDAGHKSPRRLVEAEPDVNRVGLIRGRDRFVVLGSDGLFDVMEDTDVVNIVNRVMETSGKNVDEAAATAAADMLVQEALLRRTQDNVTAAVMMFAW